MSHRRSHHHGEHKNAAITPARTATTRSWWPIIVVLIAVNAAWFVITVNAYSARHNSNSLFQSQEVTHTIVGKPGAWGELTYTPIEIEPPGEFLDVEHPNLKPARWFFKAYSRERLTEFFKSSGLTEAQLTTLLQKDKWEVTNSGIWVTPDDDLILAMLPAVRYTIYEALNDFPENDAQCTPYSFRPDKMDEQFATSGLNPKTIELLKSMLYKQGSSFLFADLVTLLPKLPDSQEKIRLYKMMSRRSSFLVTLKVDSNSNIDQLVNYWGFDGRAKDLRPLLESMARVRGGSQIDLAHLLPQFARRRVYTYPEPTNDPVKSKRDCHWSSLNFFSDKPDDGFTNPARVKKAFDTQYSEVTSEPKMGDVVLLVTPSNALIHSAVYLADGLVFTKNGAISTQPWIYMKLDDLVTYYSTFYPPTEPLRAVICRKKAG